MSVIVDGTTYNISVKSLKRKARFDYKYQELTADGTMRAELRGVYLDYELVFNAYTDYAEYSSLWAKLIQATEFHEITVPSDTGTYTFDAMLSGIGDEILMEKSSQNYFHNLTVNFKAQSPEAIP